MSNFFSTKKFFLIIITIIIIISAVFAYYNIIHGFGQWSGDGYEEPFSGGIELAPSQKNIQAVMDVTKLPSDQVINALLESDHNVAKAIKYLEDNP